MSSQQYSATCTAPVNIATVKYWGKRDEDLILPINSSLSVTLHQDQLCAKTSVIASSKFKNDRMWLNDEEIDISSQRFQNVLKTIRLNSKHLEERRKAGDDKKVHLHICSVNNFPTAAGLASSAAGFACLVYTLSKALGVETELSKLARLGSGSACRSIYGGFVAWDKGEEASGNDSVARQVAPHTHWPELAILVLVVSANKKLVGSTSGQQVSVQTSSLLKHRAEVLVPERMARMEKAILEKDFQGFAEETMKDSNQMHACCLDTYPPISYMTDTSRIIMQVIHIINKFYGCNKVAYTFDAGPNACLYLLQKDVALVVSIVRRLFPSSNNQNFLRGANQEITDVDIPKDLVDSIPFEAMPDALQFAILTKPGPGPQQLAEEENLLDANGLPRSLAK